MLTQNHYFIAIRLTEGREWFDTSCIELSFSDAQQTAKEMDEMCGSWSKDNPVVRIVRISITEIENQRL